MTNPTLLTATPISPLVGLSEALTPNASHFATMKATPNVQSF